MADPTPSKSLKTTASLLKGPSEFNLNNSNDITNLNDIDDNLLTKSIGGAKSITASRTGPTQSRSGGASAIGLGPTKSQSTNLNLSQSLKGSGPMARPSGSINRGPSQIVGSTSLLGPGSSQALQIGNSNTVTGANIRTSQSGGASRALGASRTGGPSRIGGASRGLAGVGSQRNSNMNVNFTASTTAGATVRASGSIQKDSKVTSELQSQSGEGDMNDINTGDNINDNNDNDNSLIDPNLSKSLDHKGEKISQRSAASSLANSNETADQDLNNQGTNTNRSLVKSQKGTSMVLKKGNEYSPSSNEIGRAMLSRAPHAFHFQDRHYTTINGRTHALIRHEYIRFQELHRRGADTMSPYIEESSKNFGGSGGSMIKKVIGMRVTSESMDDPRPYQLNRTMLRGPKVLSKYQKLIRELNRYDGYENVFEWKSGEPHT